MLERIVESIRKWQLLAPGDRIVVALSGGPDSMALLHILWRLAPEWRFDLVAAHFDHGLRPESAAEAVRVAAWASELGIPCETHRIDVSGLAETAGKSLEEAGREARYRWLIELARSLGAGKIAVGHTRDDQAETVLMWLLRGAGTTGLAGMPVRREEDGITIVRPLLDIGREEILAYCREQNLQPLQDPSNRDPRFLRNRIRHELLPYLEKEFAPGVRRGLVRAAEIFRAEAEFFERRADAWLDEQGKSGERFLTLPVEPLRERHPAEQRWVLRRALERLAGWYIPPFEQVERLRELLGTNYGGPLELPGGIRARLRYGRLELTEGHKDAVPFDYPLNVPGEVEVLEAGIRILADWLPLDGQIRVRRPGGERDEAILDAGKVREAGLPLRVRSRRPGDRFAPLGLGGHKKLKDFFIDRRIPEEARDSVALVTTGDRILWVVGMAVSHDFRVTAETAEALCLRRVQLSP